MNIGIVPIEECGGYAWWADENGHHIVDFFEENEEMIPSKGMEEGWGRVPMYIWRDDKWKWAGTKRAEKVRDQEFCKLPRAWMLGV